LFGDRLPALSSIISELSTYLDDVYLVGFWKRFLIEHLGWHRGVFPKPFFEGDLLERVGTPSWPWSSISYFVGFSSIDLPLARVIDCQVTRASSTSSFGEVTEGTLTIEACVVNASDVEALLNFTEGRDGTLAGSGISMITFDSEKGPFQLENMRLALLGRCDDEEPRFLKGDIALVLQRLDLRNYIGVGHAKFNPKEWWEIGDWIPWPSEMEIIVIK
jgi:hypothetical protein